MSESNRQETPELRLMKAILSRALIDAANKDAESEDGRRAHRDAVRWIEAGGAWFEKVCQLCGRDPEDIQYRLKTGRLTVYDKKRSKE